MILVLDLRVVVEGEYENFKWIWIFYIFYVIKINSMIFN